MSGRDAAALPFLRRLSSAVVNVMPPFLSRSSSTALTSFGDMLASTASVASSKLRLSSHSPPFRVITDSWGRSPGLFLSSLRMITFVGMGSAVGLHMLKLLLVDSMPMRMAWRKFSISSVAGPPLSKQRRKAHRTDWMSWYFVSPKKAAAWLRRSLIDGLILVAQTTYCFINEKLRRPYFRASAVRRLSASMRRDKASDLRCHPVAHHSLKSFGAFIRTCCEHAGQK